jgi:magnesium chelatase family protein
MHVGADSELASIEAVAASNSPNHPTAWATSLPETRDRVRAAIPNSRLAWPHRPVDLESAPVPLAALGPGCDLAIACAVLALDRAVPPYRLRTTVLVGELGLDGSIRPRRGVLPALTAAADAGLRYAIVPTTQLTEARMAPGITAYGAGSLAEAAAWLRAPLPTPPDDMRRPDDPAGAPTPTSTLDLADVAGSSHVRQTLEIAAAGGHHLLLTGPPGAGTTALARCLPGILPPLTQGQALRVAELRSLAGVAVDRVDPTAPFVAPHHSTSLAAFVGGSPTSRSSPGQISLAHGGVLFLDVTEFSPRHLDALTAAVEEKEIRIANQDRVLRYPARVQLVLAATPCPCGPQPGTDCGCTPAARRRHRARLATPLLDRVDLRISISSPPAQPTVHAAPPEPSAAVRARVTAARDRAAHRWHDLGATTNAAIPDAALHRIVHALPVSVTRRLHTALETGALSRRGAHGCLRVAWTLADLAGADRPDADHITTALALRQGR